MFLCCRDKLESLTSDEDALHRQLVQVEVCGAEAGKQVAALRDIIQRLKYVGGSLCSVQNYYL